VTVVSEPGTGSTFTVVIPAGNAHLPVNRIEAARTLAPTTLGATPYVEEALRWLPQGGHDVSPSEIIDTVVTPVALSSGKNGVRPRVLLADDNADMRDYVRRLLSAQYDVEAVADGVGALTAARRRRPDLILADVMMPSLDGFALLRELRKDADLSAVPVVLLSARAGEEARVEGWGAGADDYLVKPFAFAELLARLRALARRGDAERPTVLEVGDLRLDPAGREVRRGDSEIRLSAKEFALLETFMRRPGEVLSRLHLLEHAWDFAYENRSNVVDVYVSHLRQKIDQPFGRRSLETVRGAGYRLRADGA
jgi:two-component system OmpR family response regulator